MRPVAVRLQLYRVCSWGGRRQQMYFNEAQKIMMSIQNTCAVCRVLFSDRNEVHRLCTACGRGRRATHPAPFPPELLCCVGAPPVAPPQPAAHRRLHRSGGARGRDRTSALLLGLAPVHHAITWDASLLLRRCQVLFAREPLRPGGRALPPLRRAGAAPGTPRGALHSAADARGQQRRHEHASTCRPLMLCVCCVCCAVPCALHASPQDYEKAAFAKINLDMDGERACNLVEACGPTAPLRPRSTLRALREDLFRARCRCGPSRTSTSSSRRATSLRRSTRPS